MNQRTLPALLSPCLLALCLTGGVACNPANPTTLQIAGNMIPDQKIGTQCFARVGGQLRGDGLLDLAIGGDYPFYAQIDSLLLDTKAVSGNGEESLRPIASNISIKTIHVAFELTTKGTPFASNVSTLKTKWDLPVDAVLKAGASAVVPFSLVPGDPARGGGWRTRWAAFGKRYGYTQTVLAKISAEGTMADGTPVLSEDFQYPLTLCWGCLLSVPMPKASAEVIDPFQECTKFGSDGSLPCRPGADDFVACGLYCKMCLEAKTLDPVNKCDDKFCPGLQ